MNQQQFGLLLGKTQFDISNYEKGKNDPRLDVVIHLEELTGIAVYRLCKGMVTVDEIPNRALTHYTLPPPSTQQVEETSSSYHPTASNESYTTALSELEKTVQEQFQQVHHRLQQLEEKYNNSKN